MYNLLPFFFCGDEEIESSSYDFRQSQMFLKIYTSAHDVIIAECKLSENLFSIYIYMYTLTYKLNPINNYKDIGLNLLQCVQLNLHTHAAPSKTFLTKLSSLSN